MFYDESELNFAVKAQDPMPSIPLPSESSPLILPGEPNPENKPGLIPIFQYISNIYRQYIENEVNVGYLKIDVASELDGAPIPNTKLTISKPLGNNFFMSQVAFTDENGRVPLIPLPTRSEELSQTPSYPVPYTIWNLSAQAPGYYEVIVYDIPIFPGITTTQSFRLRPSETDSLLPAEEIFASATVNNIKKR
ncbi:carboxypeptidase-like regulatory domain-containing protein [Sinanaerobacter sp. ZZT-01]|uniref:carboxypeptidase-like regulatory domain-containing protein n=1 Tax=Sinanaerobacter sp. ZZT-01 TaxID=3111540 RepID=UPI002D793A79|nr:carboxypeptidase-like regulatory domain-containing protein [Sinanaerobacter sp. ZZT-01]WRR92576.1 carboxypeptidase-like regulatory domain-containing protein [Sinanaerobacter sp. ZZT-01]